MMVMSQDDKVWGGSFFRLFAMLSKVDMVAPSDESSLSSLNGRFFNKNSSNSFDLSDLSGV